MPLCIQAGKKYKTREGNIVGPLTRHARSGLWECLTASMFWYPTGVHSINTESRWDLVEEYEDKSNWLDSGDYYRYKQKQIAKCLCILPNYRAVVQVWRAVGPQVEMPLTDGNYYIAAVNQKNPENFFTKLPLDTTEKSNV